MEATKVVNYGTQAQECGTNATTKAKDQKTLIEEYMQLIAKEVWKDKKMLEYTKKNIGYIIQLSNGDYIEIEKPRIEKSFCFGYGTGGGTYEEASACEDVARRDVDYFMQQNLDGLNRTIKQLTDSTLYTRVKYCNSPNNSKIKYIETFKYLAYGFDSLNNNDKVKYTRLSETDKQKVLDGYKVVVQDFVKRLHTYLKRYGVSKVKTWTYWLDA